MNNTFKTTDPKQRGAFGAGDIGIVVGSKGKRNSLCWKSIEIWNVFAVIEGDVEDVKHIEMARTHKNAEVRRLNREIWCSHICQAQLLVGPRKRWEEDDLVEKRLQGWPTIHSRTYKSITVNELTDIIMTHRELVREWYGKKMVQHKVPVEPVPEPVVVVEAAAEEPEFQLDSGLDSWEDSDV